MATVFSSRVPSLRNNYRLRSAGEPANACSPLSKERERDERNEFLRNRPLAISMKIPSLSIGTRDWRWTSKVDPRASRHYHGFLADFSRLRISSRGCLDLKLLFSRVTQVSIALGNRLRFLWEYWAIRSWSWSKEALAGTNFTVNGTNVAIWRVNSTFLILDQSLEILNN